MTGFLRMQLSELFAGIVDTAPDVPVSGLNCDSRSVQPGDLFLACAGGRSHGLAFLDQALAAGAAALAWEPADGWSEPSLPDGIPAIRVPGLRDRLGLLGDRFFASPSSALAVTGITGTNGKTTTAWLAAQAMTANGQASAYMGTLGFGRIPDLAPSPLTTPDCIELHRRLRDAADRGIRHAMVEVSSHALDQGRVDGLHFAVAALTSFSRDHLDYHGSVEAYAAAKARLFLDYQPDRIVLNIGNPLGRELAARLPDSARPITVALVESRDAPPGLRLVGRLNAVRRDGLGLQFSGDFGEATLESPLWGRFNAGNLVVAAGVMLALGCDLSQAAATLAQASAPPGRMQTVAGRADQPSVIIDFAHTPDALENVLNAVREHCEGQVWCVFGCGGDRDRGKRGPMAAVAERLADHVVVTDDNPRGEDPAGIVADILSGFTRAADVEILHDRGLAIDRAIRSAGAADVVLIAGKGHEDRQIFADGARPFSDVGAAKAALGGVA